MLQISREFLEELVAGNPLLLLELSRIIDDRRSAARAALTAD